MLWKGSLELSFGHVSSEMSTRHPCADVREAVGYRDQNSKKTLALGA